MLPWSARSVVLASLLATLGTIPAYGGAYFLGLNSVEPGVTTYEAYGVSYDGSVVVGRGTKGQTGFGYLLKEGQFTDLDPAPDGNGLWPLGVSADGSVVVGDRKYRTGGSEAFRWTADTGAVGLGAATRGADAVSADGNVIVGWGIGGAFRWTLSTGPVTLQSGAWAGSRATGVSADGSRIVGYLLSGSWRQAVLWTEVSAVGLGDFSGGDFSSYATAVSADGSVIAGTGTKTSNIVEAFRWTSETDLLGLGDLPGSNLYSRATGISADGSIIVGISSTSAPVQEAFVWDEVNGMRSLSQFLSLEHSLDVDGWTFVTVRVSGDGQTFVGQALNPEGGIEAYVAHVPEPASILLFLSVLVFSARVSAGLPPLRNRKTTIHP